MTTFLIGYMASGKTSLGKELAVRLKRSFIDIDTLIEDQMRMSIFEIFTKKGEKFFRDIEKNIIRNYKFQSNTIVATGGGTPCFYNNNQFLNSIGSTIYLKVSVEEILRRLELTYTRPILAKKNLTLKSFVSNELKERERYYLKSDYIIESDNINIDILLEEICK